MDFHVQVLTTDTPPAWQHRRSTETTNYFGNGNRLRIMGQCHEIFFPNIPSGPFMNMLKQFRKTFCFGEDNRGHGNQASQNFHMLKLLLLVMHTSTRLIVRPPKFTVNVRVVIFVSAMSTTSSTRVQVINNEADTVSAQLTTTPTLSPPQSTTA